MKKYKINRTKEQDLPSKKTIEKYKDFASLSHEYDKLVRRPKVPLYKDKKMFLVLLLIVLVAYILSQVGKEEKSVEQNSNNFSTEQVDQD